MSHLNSISVLLLISWITLSCNQQSQNTDGEARNGSVIMDSLNGRKLQIYLPPGYDLKKEYPAVYFHDGQNLFDQSTAYSDEWKIDETLDSLIQNELIAPMVVVGIYNSPQRAEEYVPYNDPRIMEIMGMESWNGALHIAYEDFIILDLIPFVESKYNLSNNREDRAIFGSSFGGINALWLGMDNSDLFGFIGALSPSVWVGDGALLREFQSFESLPTVKTWIDQGTGEWDGRNLELTKLLEQKGLTYGESLWYYEDKDASHHESAWSERVVFPLLLFKGLGMDSTLSLASEIVYTYHEYNPQQSIIPRMNAILRTDRGIKYSLIHKASYSGVEIDEFGTLLSWPESELSLLVEYMDQSSMITVQGQQIDQKIKEISQR
jgi:predicted alpha/beta superfamily hydrolase